MSPLVANLEIEERSRTLDCSSESATRRVCAKWNLVFLGVCLLSTCLTGFHYLFKSALLHTKQGGSDVNSIANQDGQGPTGILSPCASVQLLSPDRIAIPLKPRDTPARLIDVFAYAFPEEYEELLLRLYEMGDVVDEIHIVEGDRDFTGNRKNLTFDAVLTARQDLHHWRKKIVYHPVEVPEGVIGYALQTFQRQAVMNGIKDTYLRREAVMLEGDLDEITSRHLLHALRNCEPADPLEEWNTKLEEGLYYYSLAWTTGIWDAPALAHFIAPQVTQTRFEANRRLYWWGAFNPYPNTLRSIVGPSGWHVAWTLDGAQGLAHKIFIHIEGRPPWAAGYNDEASLADFLQHKFLPAPDTYDKKIRPSRLTMADVPQALVLFPEKFPNLMRGLELKH